MSKREKIEHDRRELDKIIYSHFKIISEPLTVSFLVIKTGKTVQQVTSSLRRLYDKNKLIRVIGHRHGDATHYCAIKRWTSFQVIKPIFRGSV